MKKSIFVLTTLLLAFSIYIISPANLVLADKGQEDPNAELIQDDQIPSDANPSEIYPEGETAGHFQDETPDDSDERLKQEDDLLNPLSLQGGDEEKQESSMRMN